MYVERKLERQLTGKHTYYELILFTNPKIFCTEDEVLQGLRAIIYNDAGKHLLEFARPGNKGSLLEFSVKKGDLKKASKQRWVLRFPSLRVYWGAKWKNMKHAWIKVFVGNSNGVVLKIKYDDELYRAAKNEASKRHREKRKNKKGPPSSANSHNSLPKQPSYQPSLEQYEELRRLVVKLMRQVQTLTAQVRKNELKIKQMESSGAAVPSSMNNASGDFRFFVRTAISYVG